MLRFKLVLLTALVLVSTGLMSAASASAADNFLVCLEAEMKGHGKYANDECQMTGGSKEWELEKIGPGGAIGGGTEGGASKLETSLGTIECKEDYTLAEDIAELRGGGLADLPIEFRSCKLKGNSECVVSEYVLGLEGSLGRTVENETTHETTTYIELTLQKGSGARISNCSAEGKLEFKGKQTCPIPNLKKLKRVHEVICDPSGSEIESETGGKSIKFTDKEKVRVGTNVGREFFWGAE
jgi:hypothetical protein